METVQPLLPVLIDMPCQHCQRGVMRPIGKPAKRGMRHACTHCGQSAVFHESYPLIRHVDFMGFVADSQAVLNRLRQERLHGE